MASAALSSCDKGEEHPIPDVGVYFTINILSDPEFFDLRVSGHGMIINASSVGLGSLGYGNSGLIIFNSGGNSFLVYDRTCPHDIPNIVKVDLENSNIGKCPVCESRYVLPSYGNPANGSASRWALKEYRARYNPNTGDVFVHN